ncbi:MAG: hypothetical protein WA584_02820 [Pyrinomonadaceae bacterium]
MKTERKLYLRTETFEQILIRSKSLKLNFRADSEDAIDSPQNGEKYRLEVYRIETGGKRKVFECELSGSIEIIETDGKL